MKNFKLKKITVLALGFLFLGNILNAQKKPVSSGKEQQKDSSKIAEVAATVTGPVVAIGYDYDKEEEDLQPKLIISEKRLEKDTSRAGIDGPYIFYSGLGRSVVKSIKEENGVPTPVYKWYEENQELKSYITDKDFFSFRLKKELKEEPSVYPMPKKLIAISDIEGNFEQFKEFLINNKVMDKNYKWTFGEGHLVTVGDFFDRGLFVTQTLWLIYSLEEQAEKAGGKVHFVLGNHDLMNMNKDLRYVRKKYFENAKLMNEEPTFLLSQYGTELGKWLNTKNIVEKIGDYIFVHAGISKEVSDLNLSVEELNEHAREYYFNNRKGQKGKDAIANVIYMYGKSPMWYRGYGKETTKKEDLEEILKKLNAKKFVIGHTLRKEVTYLMDGRVIDIDVLHSKGKTQGLLIRNGKEYAVDIKGKKSKIKHGVEEDKED